MYPGYLEFFYCRYSGLERLSYKEHLNLILSETTEFAGSYYRNFRKLGLETEYLISNDKRLLKKWCGENNKNPDNLNEIQFEQIKLFKPEIVWIENLSFVNLELIDRIRQNIQSIKLIVGCHCAPFNNKVLEGIKGVDFIITCTPGIKTKIENLGKKAFLVYHGFDIDLLPEINTGITQYLNDFIFSGSLISGGDFHNDRIRLIERILKENINTGLYVNLEPEYKIRTKQFLYLLSGFLRKIKLENMVNKINVFEYGKSWVDMYSDTLLDHKYSPVYGIEMFKLFSQSRIVLNYHIGIAGDYAGNMRMFEVTGAGSCLLTDNKKNLSSLFDTENEVVVYDNPDDCITKVKWLLSHEDERKRIALAGQKRTLTTHSVEDRCRAIIDILNSELKFHN
jgi:spore maturation protein CgeB